MCKLELTLSINASKFGSGLSDLLEINFFLQVGHSLLLKGKGKNKLQKWKPYSLKITFVCWLISVDKIAVTYLFKNKILLSKYSFA